MRRRVFLLAAMIGLTMTGGNIAFAACSSPSGSAGKMIYNADHSMAQYCDGTNWIAMGNTPGLPSSGLVAHWKLDETSGTTAADSSGNGNDGTMNGGLSATNDSVTGQIGAALDFDGTNDCIGLGTFDVSGSAMTIAGWLYFTASGGSASVDDRFISKATSTAEADHYWMVSENSNKLRFRLKTDGTTTTLVAPSVTLPVNTWVHFVALYDGAEMRLYQDGVEVGSAVKTGTISTNGSVNVAMGCSPEGSNYMDGQLDDVRIYNRALSDSEIATLASVTESGLVAHWKLDETSGTTAADSSGNGNDGTLTNMDSATDWITGKSGTALDFDGTNDYITVAHDASLDISSAYTFSTWVWFDSNSAETVHDTLIAKNTGAGWGSGWIVERSSGGGNIIGGKIRLVTAHNRTEEYYTGWLFPVDQWIYLTITWDGSTIKYYLDGALVATGSVAQVPDTASGNLTIGYGRLQWYDSYFQGRMDDPRLYDRVLTEAEIKALMCRSTPGKVEYNLDDHMMQFCSDQGVHAMGPLASNGYTVPASGLISRWKLDETSGTTAADSVGSNNGTMLGGLNAGNDSVAGKVSTALDFDGNDQISISDTTLPSGSSARTIVAWINRSSNGHIVAWGTQSTARHNHLSVYTDKLRFGTWSNDFDGNLTLPTGTWTHVAVTFDGTNVILYVNGAVDRAGTLSGVNTTLTGSAYIGSGGSNNYLTGKIDDVLIYNRVLSPSEINVLYLNLGQCSTPSGIEGAMFYNTDDSVMQYCNGTEWIGIGK